MSLSPHQIFGRLQELKKWQKTHEKLLQRSGNTGDHERPSLNNEFTHHSSEKVGHNHLGSIKYHELGSYNNVEEEYINALLDRDFEELLEEKLSEFNEYNIQTNNTAVPKKPFLKKGTGLLKYNLKLEEYKSLIGNKYSNTVLPKRCRPNSTQTKKKTVQFQTERPKTTGGVPKTLSTKRTQNTVKSNRPSVASSQRPKTTGGEFTGRSKTQNTKKVVNNNRQVQSASNGRNLLKNVDCPKQKCPSVENKAKFRPEEPKLKKNEVIKNSKDSPSKNSENEKVQTDKKLSPKLHDFIENIVNKPVEYTPLRAPEISIKPRGNWCDIPPNNHQSEVWKNVNNDIMLKSDRISSKDVYTATTQCAQILVQSQWKNGLIPQMNEIECKMPEVETTGDPQERKVPPARKSLSYTSNENSLYEKALETELKIFEALERRTEQSGFCSTNTSIIQLLASTPSKFDFKNSEMNTVDHVLDEVIVDRDKEKSPVQDETEQKSQNDDSDSPDDQELTKFQNFPPSNWHHNENEDHIDEESEDDTESEEEIDKTLEEDFSKYNGIEDHSEHKRDSSTNTDNPIIFPSSYSSTSSDISDEYFAVTKNAYRSSRSPKNLESSESCASCGFLIKNKIEECQNELDNLKIEKDRIMAIREQMDKDKKEFEKEMKLRRIQFEEQKLRYQLEIEEERQKMADKLSPEKSSKAVKSKMQQRKDKEEMNNLKMELNEMKELMKLRDTKNAMSIARLRNQVKMLEKNNAELKAENEKLMKEKSKLAAQQKNLNKTTETKMLKEISKNISKLTEETFKNQTFKVDTSSDDNLRKKSMKEVDSQMSLKKSSNSQGILKNGTQPQVFNNTLIEDYAVEQIRQNGVEDNIEEKYKSLFGGNDVIIEENRRNSNTSLGNTTRQVGLEKTEKILEDGTKEVKYSNGNIKRISENGTVRYYYFANDTWHTNFPDGTEVLEFPNGQSEKRFKDGKCLIFFPDGLIQTIFPDGTEEVKYPDGSKLLTKADGDRMLFLTNGQVEIHTKDQKRREYPDGTVKILYPDGSQETRYSNGRVRMKNSKGEIILDTGETNL